MCVWRATFNKKDEKETIEHADVLACPVLRPMLEGHSISRSGTVSSLRPQSKSVWMATPASNDVPNPLPNRPEGRATIASVIVGLLVAVAYLGLLIVFATSHAPFEQHTPSSNLTYCCPNLAAELVKAANFSLDPCTNFLSYTCYNFHRLRGSIPRTLAGSALFTSTITGTIHSPEGKTIFEVYRSCLLAQSQKLQMPHRAMSALLAETGASRYLSSLDILRILLQLSLLHNLYTPVQFRIYRGDYTIIKTHDLETSLEQRRPLPGEETALNTFNDILQTNVTTSNIRKLRNKVAATNDTPNFSIQTISFLDSLVANVTKEWWLKMIADFFTGPVPKQVVVKSADTVRKRLFLLTTNKTERSDVRLALLLVGASAHFLWDNSYNYAAVTDTCESQTQGHTRELWAAVISDELANPQKDRIVREIFRAMRDVVISEARKLLDFADSGALEDLLSKTRLRLPGYFSFREVPIPAMKDNFFGNMLKMDRYGQSVYRFHNVHGNLMLWYTSLRGSGKLRIFKGVIVVDGSYYQFIHTGDVVDPVTNMAVLGVRMAFSFWTIILKHQGWNPISKARITGIIGCYPDITIERFSDGVTFRLALKSAATAARTMVPGWNVGLKAWSIQTLSPAQMFYMRSVFVYCDDWKTGQASAVYLEIDDFRSTFACPPRQQGWAKNCSYDL